MESRSETVYGIANQGLIDWSWSTDHVLGKLILVTTEVAERRNVLECQVCVRASFPTRGGWSVVWGCSA